MTRTEVDARNEALEEAAGHLELEWTDDPCERKAGLALAAELRSKIKRSGAVRNRAKVNQNARRKKTERRAG